MSVTHKVYLFGKFRHMFHT